MLRIKSVKVKLLTQAGQLKKKPAKRVKKPLPKHLMRVPKTLDYTTHCHQCGNECKIIGTHCVEKLAVLPALFYVIEYIHTHTACRRCDDQIYSAKAESSLVPNTQATPELLAHIAISKVCDALPLYRQSKQSQRAHCPIERNKLDRWLIKTGLALKPLVAILNDVYNQYQVGGVDETRLQVIKEANKTAYQLSYLFIRYGGPPNQRVMLVDYRPRKDQATVDELLDPFEGKGLVSDMYTAFINVADKERLKLFACHDHLRRRFVKALEAIPKKDRSASIPHRLIELYKTVYQVESQTKGRSYRVIKRMRKRSRKRLNQMYRLIESLNPRPDSLIGKAVSYAKAHKKALYAYLDVPWAPISNIMTEHIAKRIAVLRKNMLFCYSSTGAEALANLMTVIYTAELYPEHNLHEYLTALFMELPKAKTVEDLEAMLPWNLNTQKVAELIESRPRPIITAQAAA